MKPAWCERALEAQRAFGSYGGNQLNLAADWASLTVSNRAKAFHDSHCQPLSVVQSPVPLQMLDAPPGCVLQDTLLLLQLKLLTHRVLRRCTRALEEGCRMPHPRPLLLQWTAASMSCLHPLSPEGSPWSRARSLHDEFKLDVPGRGASKLQTRDMFGCGHGRQPDADEVCQIKKGLA